MRFSKTAELCRKGLSFAVVCAVLGMALEIFGADQPQTAAGFRIFHWRPFLAPFHAVALHFPIGFLTVVAILEGRRVFRPSDELKQLTRIFLWLSLISGVIAATFGLMRSEGGDYQAAILQRHKYYGFGVLGLTTAAAIIQWIAFKEARQNSKSRVLELAYRGTLAAALALLMVAGHLGGNLTHGSNYLVQNAPEFLRKLLDANEPSAAVQQAGGKEDPKVAFYKERVQPILAARCYGCHGAEKQKGGYRLDKKELAKKGGESGKEAIKPGNPLGSRLVQLTLLPPEHDDVMPPEGKKALTPEELGLIIQWIRDGAVFDDTVLSSAEQR